MESCGFIIIFNKCFKRLKYSRKTIQRAWVITHVTCFYWHFSKHIHMRTPGLHCNHKGKPHEEKQCIKKKQPKNCQYIWPNNLWISWNLSSIESRWLHSPVSYYLRSIRENLFKYFWWTFIVCIINFLFFFYNCHCFHFLNCYFRWPLSGLILKVILQVIWNRRCISHYL